MQERLICFALFFWCWCRCYKCLNMNFFFWSRKNNHLPAKNKLQSAVKIIMIMIIWIGCIHTYSCQDRHRAKIREVFSSPYKKISIQICTVKKQGIGLCSDRPRSFFWNVNDLEDSRMIWEFRIENSVAPYHLSLFAHRVHIQRRSFLFFLAI